MDFIGYGRVFDVASDSCNYVYSDVNDRRKDLLIVEFDANMLDMIMCDSYNKDTDTPAPELSVRSIEVCSYGTK